jgi:hypothetical protein
VTKLDSSQMRNFGEHTWGLSMSAITCVEPEFLLWCRPHIHWRGWRTCEGWLIWIRGAGLLLTELEQPTQA